MYRNISLLTICLFVLPVFGQDAEQEAKQLVQKAQELAKEQKFDQAIDAMKKAVQLAPRSDLYLAMTSDFEQKAGRYADGIEHALAAIKLNPKVGAYYFLVAHNAYSDQDLAKAREYCDIVLKGGPSAFGQMICNDASALQNMLAKKTYTIFWNLDPKKGRLERGSLAIALPKSDLPYQTVSYEISGVRSHRLVKGESNDVLYVVPEGTKPFPLTTKVTVEPYSYKKDLASASAKPLPADARAHLGPFMAIDPKSPVLKKIVADLKGSNSADTARNIQKWMKKNIEYKLDKSPIDQLDFKTVDEIAERGHAECRGYALLFTALCRAADIPARPVWGLVRVLAGQDKRFGDIASHNWTEVYIAGCGWVPVDPQKPESFGCLPATCMRMFMDAKKTKTSAETLPMLNLLYMNGDKLKFEESR
jgi:transglutaminase-like putative cysteine protease